MLTISLEEARKAGVSCPCVSKHVPLPTEFHKHHIVPKAFGGSDNKSNIIVICPTTHSNIHKLLRLYAKHRGRPPGSVRKHYSDFVQDLAQRAWDGVRSTGQILAIVEAGEMILTSDTVRDCPK